MIIYFHMGYVKNKYFLLQRFTDTKTIKLVRKPATRIATLSQSAEAVLGLSFMTHKLKDFVPTFCRGYSSLNTRTVAPLDGH